MRFWIVRRKKLMSYDLTPIVRDRKNRVKMLCLIMSLYDCKIISKEMLKLSGAKRIGIRKVSKC